MDFNRIIKKAQNSKFALWKLNFLLLRYIPFNRPHGLKVVTISENSVEVKIPLWRINKNHLKGIHACCLATAAEYSSGFLLLHKLGLKNYRIIMESLEVKYKYQAKTKAIASFSIKEEYFQKNILEPLQKEGSVYTKCTIQVHDIHANLICEATTNWQIKAWEKVKTKID